MRTSRAAQPRLESMEVRRVPSALGAALPAAQVLAVRAARLESPAAHQSPALAARAHATPRPHHTVKHVHSGHHAASGSSQPKNVFSNFFKSIFGGAFPKI
jgi:hypothetical protein